MPLFRIDEALHAFAHVPKCAGTTIEAHLAERFGDIGFFGTHPNWGVSLQHLTWSELVDAVPVGWITTSFAVVRHPLCRFVSSYNMRLTQKSPPFPREVTIDEFLNWVEVRLPASPTLLDNHLRPQSDFVGPQTRIFRLEEGLEPVAEYLDNTFGPSDAAAFGWHDHRPSETAELFFSTRELPVGLSDRIARLYATDFERFGYELEPKKAPRLQVLKPELAHPARRIKWRTRMALVELSHTCRAAIFDKREQS